MTSLPDGPQAFWDRHAKRDPLWAILSDPSKSGRRWDLASFLETGRREVSLLMYQLRALDIEVERRAALDFGCGVGRLSQPLAQYFECVVGVDISPEMIRLANEINREPARVRYACNERDDLAAFPSGDFTFMYSNVVLQHIEPPATLAYLAELLRLVAPGGVLVFQLPSHPKPAEERRQSSRPMAEGAYRGLIEVSGHPPDACAPGAEIVLAVTVSNVSADRWVQADAGAIRLGNHWRSAEGAMLIQDDGRAPLQAILGPGESCRAVLTVTVPSEPGEYDLELDLVHEGLCWFSDRGSSTWRHAFHVNGGASPQLRRTAELPPPASPRLSLHDWSLMEEPGELPMYGVHRSSVEALLGRHGAHAVHIEADERCGEEWVGYRYFVRKGP